MNFLDRFNGGQTLPPRIDRSLLRNLSGAQQTELLGTLDALAMIDRETGTVIEPLRELARLTGDDRRSAVGTLLIRHYDWALNISAQNGTQSRLEEAFRQRGVSGSTARKAITFFLHAAQFAGVEMSSNFIAPRTPRRPRRKGSGARGSGARDGGAAGGAGAGAPKEDEDTDVALARTLTLGNDGAVTLTVRGNLLAFPRTDRDWVLGVVQKFDDYEAAREEEDEEDD